MWVRADLQVHCSFHDDGRADPAELWQKYSAAGYDVVYLTPHADLIGRHWAELARLCQTLSGRGARLFPGLEVAAKDDRGHLLAYGLADTEGLENRAQVGPVLAQRIRNMGPVASFSVAHPRGHRPWDWAENPLEGSFGLEIMSGFQTEFALNAASTRLWRQIWRGGAAASVRSGSDWHGGPLPLPAYSTFIRVPANWREMTWRRQKYLVDLALARGWTVVSKNGSLAVLNLRDRPPGSIFYSSGESERLEFTVRFRPRSDGRYRLAVIRDDEVKAPIWERELRIKAHFSGPYLWVVRTRFAGPAHYYWLYGEGNDYLYTTPILVIRSDFRFAQPPAFPPSAA